MSGQGSEHLPDDLLGDPDDELIRELDDARLAESYGRLEGILDDYRSAARESDRASAGLRRRIMEIAEIEAARGPSLRLRTRNRREFAVAANTVRAVVREAVDGFEGLVARRVMIRPSPVREAADLDVRVSFAMRRGMALHGFEDDLRVRIVERLTRAVGVAVGRLELVLEDLDDAGRTG